MSEIILTNAVSEYLHVPKSTGSTEAVCGAGESLNEKPRSAYPNRDMCPQCSSDTQGLTDKQHEVIATALEMGYFEIPRDCTLQDLASELDISHQAASERLRRGMKTIVESNMISNNT